MFLIKVIRISIRTKSPLYILERPSRTNVSNSLRYIPGSSIFGCVGRYFLGQLDPSIIKEIYKNGAFSAIDKIDKTSVFIYFLKNFMMREFGNHELNNDSIFFSCSNAYFTEDPKINEVAPNLQTVGKCRKCNAFQDTLMFQLLQRSSIGNLLKSTPICAAPNCESPLKKSPTFVTLNPSNGLMKSIPKMRTKTGIATDYALRNVTKNEQGKGLLFRHQFICENQEFYCNIIHDSQKITIDDIENALENYGIGARRSAGFGRVKVTRIEEKEFNEKREELAESIKDDSNKLYESYRNYLNKEDLFIIPFYLSSDLIPSENTIIPNSRFLNSSQKVIRIRSITHDCWKFYNCIEMGSVGYILSSKSKIDNDGEFYRNLATSQLLGIGQLTNRGFGRPIFSSKIHQLNL